MTYHHRCGDLTRGRNLIWPACQVAQTVVSDIVSPVGQSASVEPNDIIDRLVEDIKTSLKEK